MTPEFLWIYDDQLPTSFAHLNTLENPDNSVSSPSFKRAAAKPTDRVVLGWFVERPTLQVEA